MSFPTSFNVSEVLRLLGVKGGQLPEISLATYTPVLIMGDFSRSLAAEPLEARGWCADTVTSIAGKCGGFDFYCAAPGGAIVEKCRVSSPEISANQVYFGARVHNYKWLTENFSTPWVENIGGYPAPQVNSVITSGTAVPASMTYAVTLSGDRTNAIWELGNERLYVPPGRWFSVAATVWNYVFQFEIVWREIPKPIGAP